MFEYLRKKFTKQTPVEAPKERSRAPKALPKKSEKELANENREPYISVLKFDLDPANVHQGAFELDWNDIFVARLIKAGYQMERDDTDSTIVDRWFTSVCRHIVMETWEQEQAILNSGVYVNTRKMDGGRSEIS